MKIRKTLLYSLLFLIGALQCLFLGSIIFEQEQDIYILPFIFLFIFLLASYFHTYIKEYHVEYDSWKIGIWIYIGTIAVWALRKYLTIDSVMATALVGMTAGALPLASNNKYMAQIPAAIYCGAFIAMTNIHNELWFLILAASFTFLAFILAKTIMNGIGGKLGTLAFVGVVMAYLVFYLSKQL